MSWSLFNYIHMEMGSMKPFNNIETQNLSILLFIARSFAYLGGTLLIVSSVMAILALTQMTQNVMSIASAFMLIPAAMVFLIVSGVTAAIVSIEENCRKRTEHLLQSKT